MQFRSTIIPASWRTFILTSCICYWTVSRYPKSMFSACHKKTRNSHEKDEMLTVGNSARWVLSSDSGLEVHPRPLQAEAWECQEFPILERKRSWNLTSGCIQTGNKPWYVLGALPSILMMHTQLVLWPCSALRPKVMCHLAQLLQLSDKPDKHPVPENATSYWLISLNSKWQWHMVCPKMLGNSISGQIHIVCCENSSSEQHHCWRVQQQNSTMKSCRWYFCRRWDSGRGGRSGCSGFNYWHILDNTQ